MVTEYERKLISTWQIWFLIKQWSSLRWSSLRQSSYGNFIATTKSNYLDGLPLKLLDVPIHLTLIFFMTGDDSLVSKD